MGDVKVKMQWKEVDEHVGQFTPTLVNNELPLSDKYIQYGYQMDRYPVVKTPMVMWFF